MKTKFLWFAVLASAAVIDQANAGGYRGGGRGFHAAGGGHVAAASPARARAGGSSSLRSRPTRGFSGRTIHPSQRYSSSRTRSTRPTAFRRPSINQSRATFTRSGPFTAASVNQTNRSTRFAHHRNPVATNVWNQRNTGSQFRNGNNLRNGNNRLRGDWQKHVFAQRPADWQRNWDRHSNHWWNGHRCSFINGSWVIFNIGFDPWWPYWWYYPDYDDYGYPDYGYDYPYSYDYQPGYYDSGDYQGQMYYDQNGNSDQSQGYYDSSVYRTESYDDEDADRDQSQSDYSIIVAAQERLAREGYYRGESDGSLGPEMRQALRRYQSSHGLTTTGYLDAETLAAMGLR
jgi:Putative peptidoglycan binding domain